MKTYFVDAAVAQSSNGHNQFQRYDLVVAHAHLHRSQHPPVIFGEEAVADNTNAQRKRERDTHTVRHRRVTTPTQLHTAATQRHGTAAVIRE